MVLILLPVLGLWVGGISLDIRQDEGEELTLVAEEVLTSRWGAVALVTLFAIEQFGNALEDSVHGVLLGWGFEVSFFVTCLTNKSRDPVGNGQVKVLLNALISL